MVLAQDLAQATQRAPAEADGRFDLAELGQVAGQVRGDGEGVVVVAAESALQAGEGLLVQPPGVRGARR
jgi:hypothetical protein